VYEEVPAILDIASAVAAGSFYDNVGPPAFTTDHEILSGDVAGARAAAAAAVAAAAKGDLSGDLVVVSGEMRVGGQEHFYLEPNTTLVVPSEVISY
jgi:xanthine dehydrogenase/oxidase